MIRKNRQTSRTPYLPTLLTLLMASLFLLIVIPQNASASVLSDTIAQMQPGEWRTLTPANVSTINNASNWAVYADSATWDPISHKLLFLGSYHATPYKFPIYSESTNSWSAGPGLPNIPFSQIFVGHGYDFNTIDGNGNFYYRMGDDLYNYVRNQIPSAQQMFKYNIGANTWTTLPPNTLKSATTCCEGIAYFPERGGIVHPDSSGKIWFFSDSNQQWSLITAIAGWGSTWNFTEYNPVHKLVLFGSSTGRLFKMDSAGTVTPLNNIPITIYDGSGFTGHVTVDPLSGDFLVLTASGTSPNTFKLYTYNVLSDTWALASYQPPSTMTGAVVSAPVSTYGVNIFASCGLYSNDCDGKIYVYKHSSGSATPRSNPTPTVSLTASPTSISSGGAATLTWTSTNAASCSASGGWSGAKTISGSQNTGMLTTDTVFTLACTGSGGSASQSAAVTLTSSTTTGPTSTGGVTLLVKFGKSSALSSFGLTGWSTVIKDIYTDYQDIGPGGTTIVGGNNYSYNYQGVTGSARNFQPGEKIRATWYNNSADPVSFIPNISFTDSDRITSGGMGTWYSMPAVTIPSFGSASTEYTFTPATAGSYSLVNVNVNYSNTMVVIADKLELVGSSSTSGTTTPSVPTTPTGTGTSTTPSPTNADADFQARCSAPGVVKCWGFDNAADGMTLNTHIFAGDCTTPSIDTATKASGAGALKFSLPASCPKTANIAGKWEPQGNVLGAFDGVSFGGGSTFYTQFRMRITSSMLTNRWDSSWKFYELLYNYSTYGNLGFVWVNKDLSRAIAGYQGASNIMIGQAGTGGCLGPNMPSGCPSGPNPPYSIQQFDDGRKCDYREWGTLGHPDCLFFTGDVWQTFKFKVTYGTKNAYNSRVEGWYMKDGDSGFTKFLDTGPNFLIGGGVTNELNGNVFNTANFSTYMTALTSCASGCQDAAMWIDEFIISTQDIAAPGGTAQAQSTPAAPGNLTIR